MAEIVSTSTNEIPTSTEEKMEVQKTANEVTSSTDESPKKLNNGCTNGHEANIETSSESPSKNGKLTEKSSENETPVTSSTIEETATSSENVDPLKETEKNGTLEEVEKTEKSLVEEAAQAFLQGKRDLAIKDYGAAVTSLAKACELLTSIHGDLADELGDVYFHYGKALFANARSESSVLGDQIDKDQEGEDEDDEGEGEDGEGEEKNEAEGEKSGENGGEPMEVQAGEAGEEEQEGEAEADDLQLSWQILEMAKVVFSRKADEDKETGIKLSEVYLTLGEIGLESESYGTAVQDIQTCLEIQLKNLPGDDRRIAETLYQLGIAHSISTNYKEASVQFQESIKQLERRLNTLEEAKTAGKKVPDGEVKDSFYTIDGEITEIKAVIQDIKDKIVDMEESKTVLITEFLKRAGGLLGDPSSASGTSSSAAGSSSSTTSAAFGVPSSSSEAKPVTDISHLVRKKRKNEDDEGNAEKKPKVEES